MWGRDCNKCDPPLDASLAHWHTPVLPGGHVRSGGIAMTRGVWAGLVVCAVGCAGPRYYEAPAEKLPPVANVRGTTVQVIDQRPEWEKKPFTGVVSLYHLDKAQPGAWALLADEVGAAVAQLPEK